MPKEAEADFRTAQACRGEWARTLAGDAGWKKDFTPLVYYEHTRKEIEREDNITNQRLTWAVSIQAFLMAAVGFLLSGIWPTAREHLPALVFREMALGAVGLAGFVAAYISYQGVRASREHIARIKSDWFAFNKVLKVVPEMAPHTFGSGPGIVFGTKYALLIPQGMQLGWVLYTIAYLVVIGPSLWTHLRGL